MIYQVAAMNSDEYLANEILNRDKFLKELCYIATQMKSDVNLYHGVTPLTQQKYYKWVEDYDVFKNTVKFRQEIDDEIFNELMTDWKGHPPIDDPFDDHIDEVLFSQGVLDDVEKMLKIEVEKRRPIKMIIKTMDGHDYTKKST